MVGLMKTKLILTILIPIVFFGFGFLLQDSTINFVIINVIAQLLCIILMIPYFILYKHKYIKLNEDITKKSLMVSLGLISIYFIIFVICFKNGIVYTNNYGCLYLVSAIILAPIMEEMYYRGIVLDILNKLDTKYSIIISSLFFSLAHFRYYGMPQAMILMFFIGVILSILRNKYRSLIPSMFAHGTYNYLTLLITKIKL